MKGKGAKALMGCLTLFGFWVCVSIILLLLRLAE